MPSRTPPPSPATRNEPPETVDPKWLLRAFAAAVGVALLCGYGVLCFLFVQGQWQLALHPGPAHPMPPPAAAEVVHFGPDATARPQLTGWWIPAASDAASDAHAGAQYGRSTLLYLRSGDGTLTDDLAAINALHDAGVTVLAFNYRGYPASAGHHPAEQTLREDADAAWQYLVAERHLLPQRILPYGVGVGASLAVHLASEHRDTPGLILDQPAGDLLDHARQSPQGYLLPVRLLFHERFPLAAPLAQLSTPKLIISRTQAEVPAARQAADPKFTVDLPPGSSPAAFQATLRRFLDQYLPPTPVTEILPGSHPTGRPPQEPLK